MPNKGEQSILVIEDNPGDFALIEEFLFEQITAPVISHARSYSAAKDILLAKEAAFDIILLDLSLPDKTGLPLIQEIAGLGLNIPVIVLTGYADLNFGVKSLSLGVSDYILKDELTALSLYKSIVYSSERKRIATALEISEMRARNFAKQLSDALETERSRIAREIHDEFGQQLTGLKMSLSSLKKFNDNCEGLEAFVDALVIDVNNSIQTIRHIANELRPALLDKLGLFAAIEWLVSEIEKKTGITSQIYVAIDQPVIDKGLEINIFRICQETLTNVVKHAEATMVNIRIEHSNDILTIKIVDNGKGIKAGTLHNPLSMGLLNLKERANLIGAELTINSYTGEGTTVELILNLNGKENINSRRSLSN